VAAVLSSTLPAAQEFLQRKERLDRGDFVDVDSLECTPKVTLV
jgi:hypothetical protein